MDYQKSTYNDNLINKMLYKHLLIEKLDSSCNRYYSVNDVNPFIITNSTFTLVIHSKEISYIVVKNNKLLIRFKKSVMEHNLWAMPEFLQVYLEI